MKRTLDQIRASVAINKKDEISRSRGGSDKSKSFPTMIQNNGLLAALAFAINKKNGDERAYYSVSEAIVAYLNQLNTDKLSITNNENIGNSEALALFLSKCDREAFRRINKEALVFLNYLRRFVS